MNDFVPVLGLSMLGYFRALVLVVGMVSSIGRVPAGAGIVPLTAATIGPGGSRVVAMMLPGMVLLRLRH